jgi:hypothetical protein
MTTDLTASMRALQAEPTGPAAQNGQPGPRAYSITFTDDKTPKLVLPDVPAHDDLAGLAAWQTGVLQFDPNHPATGGVHEGSRGADGHAVILRAGAPPIRFEPASKANTARQLLPTLSWQLLPTDGEPSGFKDEHCRRIAHVLRLLCGVSTAPTVAQETAGIVRTFLSSAYADEGHTTHGTGGQRYEAAVALQHEPGAPSSTSRAHPRTTSWTPTPASSSFAWGTSKPRPGRTQVRASRSAGLTRGWRTSAGADVSSTVTRCPDATAAAVRTSAPSSTAAICRATAKR